MLSNEWNDLCRGKLGMLRRLDATPPAEVHLEPGITPPFFEPIVGEVRRP